MCLAQYWLDFIKILFLWFIPPLDWSTFKRQALIYFECPEPSMSHFSCLLTWAKPAQRNLWVFPLIHIGIVGKEWQRDPWNPRRVGWLFPKALEEGGGKWVRAEAEKSPEVKAYGLLHVRPRRDYLIQTSYFTNGKTAWRSHMEGSWLHNFFTVMRKFPCDS
jgi:hypothetical protein